MYKFLSLCVCACVCFVKKRVHNLHQMPKEMCNPQEAEDHYYNIRLWRDGHSATPTDGGDDYKQARNPECASNVGA